jgi:hypothetical protein
VLYSGACAALRPPDVTYPVYITALRAFSVAVDDFAIMLDFPLRF